MACLTLLSVWLLGLVISVLPLYGLGQVQQLRYAGVEETVPVMKQQEWEERDTLAVLESAEDKELEPSSNRDLLPVESNVSWMPDKITAHSIILVSALTGLILISLLTYRTYHYHKRIRKAYLEINEQREQIRLQSEKLQEVNQTIATINRELENKIEERTLALSRAYRELDTFFYRSSHDFRRPVTTFLGLAEVAKVMVKDPQALELFEKVRETAVSLDRMIVKLQSVSDVGSQQLESGEVHVEEIFKAVCDGFREEILSKNIRTSCEVNLSSVFFSYPAVIRLIIENLVENAVRFSGTENPFIQLRAYPSRGSVVMEIQDNGQGISEEYHSHIFEMYFRANERSKGNGLGLYIVKKAVEKLEGTVSLCSIPGVGSTFTVMVPGDIRNASS